jgi:hypothetical protein
MPFYTNMNSNNSIGGPARVLLVPAIGTYPHSARISEIFDLGTYLPNTTTYGWVDIGETKTPTRIQEAVAKTDWRSEQFGLYRSQPTDWTGQVVAEALEMTQQNKLNLMLASNPGNTGDTSPTARSNFSARTSLPYVRLAAAMLDQFNKIHISIFPKCQWDGAAIATSLARGDSESIPMTWTAFPDDSIIDSVTNVAVFRYDFDQI